MRSDCDAALVWRCRGSVQLVMTSQLMDFVSIAQMSRGGLNELMGNRSHSTEPAHRLVR